MANSDFKFTSKDRNIGWTVDQLINEYQKEHPEWLYERCKEKAILIHKELNGLNYKSKKSGKRYFINNVPFSFFENNEQENEEHNNIRNILGID
jgi:hypothetical protein